MKMNPKLNHPKIQKEVDFGRLIVLADFGSHVYGTATPSSDTDIKGVFIPRGRDIVLGRAASTQTIRTNDAGSGVRNTSEDVDLELFSLYRFLELLSQGQTVALDLLFTPPQFIQRSNGIWDHIQENRHRLLNKKCKAAIGYAKSQANKYSLRGARMSALEDILNVLEPSSKREPHLTLGDLVDWYGGPIEFLRKHVSPTTRPYVDILKEENEHLPDGHIKYLSVNGKQAGFTSSVKQAWALYKKEYDQYGDRAKSAKEQGGADWKAMYHAVRIAKQTVELLETGNITFPRPEAELLLRIRRGEVAVETVSGVIEDGIREIEAAQAKSTLPESSDQKFIDDLVYDRYRVEIEGK